MARRIVLGLSAGCDIGLISSEVQSLGASIVRGPSSNAPDVMVVTIEDDASTDRFLRRAKALKGVKYAEPDSWQSTS